jgi:hypothetical protein
MMSLDECTRIGRQVMENLAKLLSGRIPLRPPTRVAAMLRRASCLSLAILVAVAARADDELPAGPVRTIAEARQRVKETPGSRNLHRIGLAMHNYHDLFSQFPPTVVMGPDGKTPHSWRVELLPLLDPNVRGLKGDRPSYEAAIRACGYDVTRPWDSPENAAALKAIPEVFRHPDDDPGTTESAFYAIVGPETAMSPDGISLSRLSSPGSALAIVECRSREPWTKPVDVFYFESAATPRLGGFTKGGFLGVACDGAVHFIPDGTKNDTLRAFMTRQTDDAIDLVGVPWRP